MISVFSIFPFMQPNLALHYDEKTLRTLNSLKMNIYLIINKLQECSVSSVNLLKHSSVSKLSDEKRIYFSVCLCRLFYSLTKFTSRSDLSSSVNGNSTILFDNSSSSYSSYVDSIFNTICSTFQWLDKNSLTNNNNKLVDSEVLKSMRYVQQVIFSTVIQHFVYTLRY